MQQASKKIKSSEHSLY